MTDTTTKQTATYLTPEAHARLQAELAHLKGEGRTEISQRIEEAREEGDLKENGGYHAAKEEQGKMEARIRQLEQLLQNVTIGDAPADDGVVEPGMIVTVEMFGDTEKFLLGSREIIGDDETLTVYSEKSPMGAAILGHGPGDNVTFTAPNGKSIDVKVISATPYSS
ncbi:transcription elongation factor GreA [Ornithinimicrobium ciconiae]|uniref:Transcription elongation factor GreA n=1 Tax=Ornithinimicrobium ciconiae TaxID=2594265 RepID=A0A516GDW7_9MICO|nr:transcription elongation factor GreA [Ornithinimicrobium ciconiae]QDO89717.1 transcription elongation factor GreA [Ornithinimicrobium ciconiae]